MTKKNDIRCTECGGPMIRETRKLIWTYRGRKIEYIQPGLFCTKCSNDSLSDKDVAATEKKLFAFRKKVDAELDPLLPPSRIKSLREALNLSQKMAGELFGGGPMAFSKYERGQYKQPASTDILLRLLESGKITLGDIEAIRKKKSNYSGSVA